MNELEFLRPLIGTRNDFNKREAHKQRRRIAKLTVNIFENFCSNTVYCILLRKYIRFTNQSISISIFSQNREIYAENLARDKMDLKLIELVQPHVTLYDERTKSSTRSHYLWNGICAEMNKTFSLNRSK